MGVVDELDETLTSEQRRLLCAALQQEYDEDYEASFVDSDSEAEEERQVLRVRTVINIARPPSLWYVLGPLILQALLSSFTLWIR